MYNVHVHVFILSNSLSSMSIITDKKHQNESSLGSAHKPRPPHLVTHLSSSSADPQDA